MKTPFIFPVLTIFVSLAAIAGAATQSIEPELDLAAIRAKAEINAGEAEALAAMAQARAKALMEEADANARGAQTHGQAYTQAARAAAKPPSQDTFDFDRMVVDAGAMATSDLGEAPRFIAFASLSMPPAALKQMIRDVNAAGGVVALRGFPQGSAKAFTEALGQLALDQDTLGQVGIDPRLFRAFNVTAVPTYVVASSDFDLCDGFDCQTTVPPHDRISGNVKPAFALETIARGQGPAARIASQYLGRLERTGQ
ncbi:type-F conjugative transfer system pilin assembly protein TrbC [Alteraurantiacibacter palmitatis]|uniref:Type-F conjugative transfer system pilin assembly protein TrbC n=1 Tax=Alteraurantiacibacter palmitatis TaxID=2054628 RepID=A0ABV7E2T0_9SPHN